MTGIELLLLISQSAPLYKHFKSPGSISVKFQSFLFLFVGLNQMTSILSYTVISYYFNVFSSVKGVVLVMTCLIKICHSQSLKLDTPWHRPVKISNTVFKKP
jgi:hypothetical protein